MGDRTTIFHPCPQCHKEMETYDAPSCLIYSSTCKHCGFKDLREYFEISEYEIVLMTPEQLEELKEKDPKIKKFREELEKLEQRAR